MLQTDLKAIFAGQQAARWQVAASTAGQRRKKLKRLKAAIAGRRLELARALRADFGKHAFEFEFTEMAPCLAEINFARRHLMSWMRPRRAGTPWEVLGTRSTTRYQPKGVVLILSPWNYPLFLSLPPLVSAIAAGNCVMFRPSSKVPRFARVLAQAIRSCFDESEVAVVLGGHETGQALLKLPFDHILFTGSTRVGREVMKAASRHLSGVTLELGGKSPAVVDESADLAWAARCLAWGKFVNAGQTCVAPDYVLVQASVAGPFLGELKTAVGEFYGPDEKSRQASPDFCRLVDQKAFDRLKAVLEKTLKQGATLETGGRMDARGLYMSPTILSGVRRNMAVMREEIFGPLLPVLTFDRREEAFEFLKGRDTPLALYIFSRDKRAVRAMLASTVSGGTLVNNTLMQLANPNLPYGGVGASGLGHTHGFYGFAAFSHLRPVMEQKWPRLSRLFHPPYAGRWKALVAWALKHLE